MKNESFTFYKSPIGLIKIASDDKGINSLIFEDHNEHLKKTSLNNGFSSDLKECLEQLDEYFNGNRLEFSVNISPKGTEFQKMVWNELKKIPFGKTCTYLDIAQKIGRKTGSRAVGNANGKNPVSIIVPCHRVIGTNKRLIGYAGGIWRKKWLLDHEQKVLWCLQYGIKYPKG